MRKITKRAATIATVAVVGMGALGATAWANGWFTSTATATVSSAQVQTVTGTVSFSEPLYPSAAVDVKLTLANPNKYKIRITAITLTGDLSTNCTAADSHITFDDPRVVLAANMTPKVYTATGAAHMSIDANADCAGLNVPNVAVTLTGAPTGDAASAYV
jgi:hypothetical protein